MTLEPADDGHVGQPADPAATTDAAAGRRTPGPGQYSLDGMQEGAVVAAYRSYSGPLPDWQQYDGYERVLEGSADRIMRMAEKDQTHAIEMDRARLELDRSLQDRSVRIVERGQWQGFLLALVFLAGGLAIIAMGNSGVGLGILAAGVAAVVGVYAVRRVTRRSAGGEAGAELVLGRDGDVDDTKEPPAPLG